MPPVIVWFRQDLRLADQLALTAAAATGQPVIPLYILDDTSPGNWKHGSASRWWLDKSLAFLAASLESLGSRLILREGQSAAVLTALAEETGASTVYTQAAYEPWASALEQCVHDEMSARGIEFKRMAGAVIKRPGTIRTQAGQPFKVYTPFWRAFQVGPPVATPVPAPKSLAKPTRWPKSDTLASWHLHPTKPDWTIGFGEEWTPGEAGAHTRLETFLDTALRNYADDRNRPDRPGTSKLSPHLHFGEISPATCWHAAISAADRIADNGGTADRDLDTFQRELVWREFATHLLVHWPALPEQPFKPEYAKFSYRNDPACLRACSAARPATPS